jgi:transcription antitermination factor NusG
VPHLIPIRRVVRVRANRSRYVVDEPVFMGYVFVAGDDPYCGHEALHAVPGRLQLVAHAEDAAGLCRDLSNLLDAIDSGAPVGPTREYIPGRTRVRVVDGVLAGTEGTYLREARRDVLLLDVLFLGKSAECEVEAWQVEVIGS